jgi:hypothetical protein
MLLETMMICALTMTAPYYDCDRPMWEVNLYDDRYLGEGICPNWEEGVKIAGCAIYLLVPDYDFIVHPVINISMPSRHYVDEWGMGVLEHEIRHIKCRCNWEGHP